MMRLGLMGWPVAHSLSPRIQNAALRAVGLKGEYSLFPLAPSLPLAFESLLDRVRAGELSGLNVTIPHKQAVIPFLDDLTPSARAIGAVNTIYLHKGQLIGHNTDAPGFVADLRNKLFGSGDSWNSASTGRALILGAGGSARAVVWALASAGWRLTLAARRLEQAEALVQTMEKAVPGCAIDVTSLNALDGLLHLSETTLIVNTTSVGMSPNVNFSPWQDGVSFPDTAVLYDLIYNPRETLLVMQARKAGLRAVTGLGMLVEQAALGFEIWTGCSAPRETMFLAVEA